MVVPKFRAWDKNTKKMNGMAEIYRNRKQEIELLPRDDNIIFMQSTGLYDKNGVEIFEGDIVEFEDADDIENVYINQGVIEWCQGGFTVSNRTTVTMDDLLDEDTLEVTIIGNVYQNPELMEENK